MQHKQCSLLCLVCILLFSHLPVFRPCCMFPRCSLTKSLAAHEPDVGRRVRYYMQSIARSRRHLRWSATQTFLHFCAVKCHSFGWFSFRDGSGSFGLADFQVSKKTRQFFGGYHTRDAPKTWQLPTKTFWSSLSKNFGSCQNKACLRTGKVQVWINRMLFISNFVL